MNVALRQRMTLQEFLAWEERQELRYEFDGFSPVAMTGGTVGHDRISMNLAVVLGGPAARQALSPLRQQPQDRGHGPHPLPRRVRVPAALRCRSSTVTSDPVVIFEVLEQGHGPHGPDRQEPGVRLNGLRPPLRHAGAGRDRGDRVRARR
ncbi:MAG: hypothetical protein WKF40_09900 [Thermoleophilaceae bacterium]